MAVARRGWASGLAKRPAMNRTLLLLSLLFALTLSPARADETEDRATLIAAYQSMTEAYIAKDLKAIQRLVSPTFTSESNGQILNAREWLSSAMRAARLTRDMSVQLESMSVDYDEATCVAVFTSVLVGKDAQTGKRRKVVRIEREQEVWIRDKGQWKLVHSLLLPIRQPAAASDSPTNSTVKASTAVNVTVNGTSVGNTTAGNTTGNATTTSNATSSNASTSNATTSNATTTGNATTVNSTLNATPTNSTVKP